MQKITPTLNWWKRGTLKKILSSNDHLLCQSKDKSSSSKKSQNFDLIKEDQNQNDELKNSPRDKRLYDPFLKILGEKKGQKTHGRHDRKKESCPPHKRRVFCGNEQYIGRAYKA